MHQPLPRKSQGLKYELRSAATIQDVAWRAHGTLARERHDPTEVSQSRSQLFTQFVPGHVHLHDAQLVKREVEKLAACAELQHHRVDDGIAMGHDGPL